MGDTPAPRRSTSSTGYQIIRKPFTLEQETQIYRIGLKVFKEQFEPHPRAQQAFGEALLNLHQTAVSKFLKNRQTLAPERAEVLAELAGYDSLEEMLGGPYGADAVRAATNLQRCLDYHGTAKWPKFVVAAAQAGLFEEDCTPHEWPTRLDRLQAYLKKFSQ